MLINNKNVFKSYKCCCNMGYYISYLPSIDMYLIEIR